MAAFLSCVRRAYQYPDVVVIVASIKRDDTVIPVTIAPSGAIPVFNSITQASSFMMSNLPDGLYVAISIDFCSGIEIEAKEVSILLRKINSVVSLVKLDFNNRCVYSELFDSVISMLAKEVDPDSINFDFTYQAERSGELC